MKEHVIKKHVIIPGILPIFLNMSKKSELLGKVSPIDVLEEFSTLYIIEENDNQIIAKDENIR